MRCVAHGFGAELFDEDLLNFGRFTQYVRSFWGMAPSSVGSLS